jgi:hypothetical protein
MTIKNKNLILKMIVGIFLIAFLNLSIYGYVWANYSPIVFCEECDEKSTINNFVIEGGGHFLKGYSYVLTLLNKIELSDLQGIDYKELQQIADNAVSNMDNAKTTYLSLVELAASTPYNPGSIQKLKDFDYDCFQNEHQLNSIIFKEAVSYLEKGDVRGIYNKLLVEIENILNRLYSIKSAIDSETFPEIPAIWKLNQACSETMLFGQYAAEIFYNIK